MIDSRGSGRPSWQRLPGALADSLDARSLVLAALGLLVAGAGHWAIARSLGGPPPAGPLARLPDPAVLPWETPRPWLSGGLRVLASPYLAVAAPLADTLRLGGGNLAWTRSLVAGLWALVVWSLFGGAIARLAVVRAADEVETVGLLTALRFALARAGSLLAAPLGPLLAAALLCVLLTPLGLLGRAESVLARGALGVLGFLPLLGGLALSLILLGLAAAWPLMVLTVAAEGEDAFDAVSRSYSYVGHRPLRYGLAVLTCALVGLAGLFVVVQGARLTLHLASWALAFGAPDELAGGLFLEGTGAARFWGRLVHLAVVAWPASYFWAAMARIYLLLRREVDGAPWEDIYMPHRDAELESFAPPFTEPVPPTETRAP